VNVVVRSAQGRDVKGGRESQCGNEIEVHLSTYRPASHKRGRKTHTWTEEQQAGLASCLYSCWSSQEICTINKSLNCRRCPCNPRLTHRVGADPDDVPSGAGEGHHEFAQAPPPPLFPAAPLHQGHLAQEEAVLRESKRASRNRKPATKTITRRRGGKELHRKGSRDTCEETYLVEFQGFPKAVGTSPTNSTPAAGQQKKARACPGQQPQGCVCCPSWCARGG